MNRCPLTPAVRPIARLCGAPRANQTAPVAHWDWGRHKESRCLRLDDMTGERFNLVKLRKMEDGNANRENLLMHNKDATPLRFADVQLTTGVQLHYAEQGARPVIRLFCFTATRIRGSRIAAYCHPSL